MPIKQLTSQFKITSVVLILLTSLFILITANITFFQQVELVYPWHANQGFIISLAVVVLAVLYLLGLILSCVMPVRIALTLLLLIAAGAGYFTYSYGTIFDTDMNRNVMQTDVAEAGVLVTFSLLIHVVLFGGLPAVLLWRIPLRTDLFLTRIKHNLIAFFAVFVMATLSLFGSSGQYASFFREHKPLRYFINPLFPVYSAGRYVSKSLAFKDSQSFIPSATYTQLREQDEHRELVIVVVGETARTDHFSLNGSSRQTNPLLEKIGDLISYSDITACGTSTAVSVLCMFAVSGHDALNASLQTASRLSYLLAVVRRS